MEERRLPHCPCFWSLISAADVKSHLQKYRLKANKKARQKEAEAAPAAPRAADGIQPAVGPAPAAAAPVGGGGAFSRHLPGLLSSPAVLPNNMVPVAPATAGEIDCCSITSCEASQY